MKGMVYDSEVWGPDGGLPWEPSHAVTVSYFLFAKLSLNFKV